MRQQSFLFLISFLFTFSNGHLSQFSLQKSLHFTLSTISGGNTNNIPSNSAVIKIKNKEQFNYEIEKAKKLQKLIVVDFSAQWCGPCRMISPHYDEISTLKKYSQVSFLKVDVDEVREIVSQYHVRSMPTFLFLGKDGEITRFSGANIDLLHETIEKSLKSFHNNP